MIDTIDPAYYTSMTSTSGCIASACRRVLAMPPEVDSSGIRSLRDGLLPDALAPTLTLCATRRKPQYVLSLQ